MNYDVFLEPLNKSLTTINTVAKINKTAGIIKTISYVFAATVICVNIIQLMRQK